MFYKNSIRPGLRFRGVTNVATLADLQVGPTCGFEAVENVIQLFRTAGNDLVEKDLIPRATHYDLVFIGKDGTYLKVEGYIKLLEDYGIRAAWYPFDPSNIVFPCLLANHVIIAVGDLHYLGYDPPAPHGRHAFVITNYYLDPVGAQILGFVGLDLNVQNRELVWSFDAIRAAVTGIQLPLLITLAPANWSSRAPGYRLSPSGSLVPNV